MHLPLTGTKPTHTAAIIHAVFRLAAGTDALLDLQPPYQAKENQRLDKLEPATARPPALKPAGPGGDDGSRLRSLSPGPLLGVPRFALGMQGHEIGSAGKSPLELPLGYGATHDKRHAGRQNQRRQEKSSFSQLLQPGRFQI